MQPKEESWGWGTSTTQCPTLPPLGKSKLRRPAQLYEKKMFIVLLVKVQSLEKPKAYQSPTIQTFMHLNTTQQSK